jgi:hypothetical protein
MSESMAVIKSMLAQAIASQCPSPGLCKALDGEVREIVADLNRAKGGAWVARIVVGMVCGLVGGGVGAAVAHMLK